MLRQLLSEPAWLISGGVLIAVYVLIASELVHRTTAAVMGATLLLLAMMMIVAVLEETGVFQWLAAWLYERSRGSVGALAVMLVIFTAAVSTLLDNVTTMLLLTPVIIEICRALDVRPWSILMPAVLGSNIGGAATLIGDPPNILIGSYAGLDFNAFLVNLGPFALLALAMMLGVM